MQETVKSGKLLFIAASGCSSCDPIKITDCRVFLSQWIGITTGCKETKLAHSSTLNHIFLTEIINVNNALWAAGACVSIKLDTMKVAQERDKVERIEGVRAMLARRPARAHARANSVLRTERGRGRG